jgi:hypothetical protein
MKKIILFDYKQTGKIYLGNEFSEPGHDVVHMNYPLPADLIDHNLDGKVERRKSRRVQVKEHGFALARPIGSLPLRIMNKSMGEIACIVYRSKPIMFGKINNISRQGLSFCYIDGTKQSKRPLMLEILVAHHGLYLENLSFKIISDFELNDDISANPIKMRQLHVEFNKLSSDQIYRLEHIILKLDKQVPHQKSNVKKRPFQLKRLLPMRLF